ncbi:hypothetical protein ACFL3F_03680 [Planctomycetota bacterium]
MKVKHRMYVVVLVVALGVVMLLSPKVRRVLKKRLRFGPEPILVTPKKSDGEKILFLHHSTGNRVWIGGVQEAFKTYNRKHHTAYHIREQAFPKREPYGWHNYPYDYWNIWINHQDATPFQREPTLEMICAQYDVVVFKHCYPVSKIDEDIGKPDIASDNKRIENYKLQYDALKAKMHAFPETQFILWTGAALVQGATNEAQAIRAQAFFTWVKGEWDEPGDNIFLWDFYTLETSGTLYMRPEYSSGPTNSHPHPDFCKKVAPFLTQRIADIIEGLGDTSSLTGER